jgi:hypothetical protein
MIGELYINGKDAYSTWGVGFEDKAISALLTPPPQKQSISNTSRLEDGKRVITQYPKIDARDLTLPFHIIAETKQQFFARYNAFCAELAKGRLEIRSSLVPATYYRVDYIKCTQFASYDGTMGIFSLQVNEPNPRNRSAIDIQR